MVQTKGQQQTFQRTIDERSQNRRSLGRVGDPDAKVVDAGLHHRPEQRQHHGDDHRVGNDHHGHEALAVEESQRIRQLAEVVVFIVSHAAHKTGDDAHEHTHVQRRGTQHRGEVAVDGDLLAEQGVGHGVGVCQHGAGNAEDVAGDHVDERKGQHSRIMAQMGYEPNFEAEPSEAFSKTIGIILPSSQRDVYENSFHLEIIRGIGQFCNQRRYVNTVITGEDDAEVLDAIQSMVANTQADGFILLYSKKDCPVAAYLRSEGLLHVIVGKAAQSANQTIYIDNDNALTGEEATDYLYEMGHRRIAYFGVSNAMLFSAERKRGYQMSLLKHDITPRGGDCVEIDTLNDSYEPALKALLTAPDRPTAVLVSDDILAVVLEQFCSKLGLRIPKDLSIVSFNNSLFSRITNPPLTTVDVNPYQLGIEAASQTINHIENPNLLATKIIVPHQLIVRESCCPPPENRTAALPGGAL